MSEKSATKMYVVYAKNQFTLLGNEYFGTDGKDIIGYHDPKLASHFSSKEKAEEFCKLFDYGDRKIEPLDKHVKLFEKCTYVYRKMPMLDKKLDIKYDPKKHDALAVLDWRMENVKSPEKSVSYESYRTWPDLYSVFSHLHSLCSYSSIDSIDHREISHTAQLKTSKNSSYEDFRKEFDLVLKYCSFIDDEGRKRFPIIDHELSMYETRFLVYGGDEGCAISNGGYDIFKGTLKECFEEMKRKYWYD
jgi:hypothetical protein